MSLKFSGKLNRKLNARHLLPFHEVIAKNDKHFSEKQSKYCSLSTLERKAGKGQSKKLSRLDWDGKMLKTFYILENDHNTILCHSLCTMIVSNSLKECWGSYWKANGMSQWLNESKPVSTPMNLSLNYISHSLQFLILLFPPTSTFPSGRHLSAFLSGVQILFS